MNKTKDDRKRGIEAVSPSSDPISPPQKCAISTSAYVNKENTYTHNMANTGGQVKVATQGESEFLTVSEFKQTMQRFEEMLKPLSKLDSLVQSVEDLKVSVNSAQNDALEAKTLANKSMAENKVLRDQVETLQNTCEMLKKSQIDIDDYGRRENLVFEGVPHKKDENVDYILRDLFVAMGLTTRYVQGIQFQRCHRLGGSKSSPKPIIVRFLWYPDRANVWGKRKTLKQITEFQGKHGVKMFVKENFSATTESKRNILTPIMKYAWLLPEVKEAYLVRDKLCINGQNYTVNDLDRLPRGLKPNDVCERENDDVLIFWRKESRLSNFHPCQFSIDGTVYNCNEQFYCAKMADTFNDPTSKDKIMNECNPGRQKDLARSIKNFDKKTWDSVKEGVMRTGLEAKFSQNDNLKRYLLSTRGKLIAESTHNDSLWGNGVNFYNKEALDPSTWTGRSLLGKLLMEIRDSW